jgi:ABC-type transport system involved in multi-copper enzyme maturation permease subunit
MNRLHIVRAEIRKLTSTRMPLAFLIVFLVIGAATAVAVAFGTDMDGSQTFISTGSDQQSLMAFAANSVVIAALFGTIAVAREYGHGTVVLTFLTTPQRSRAVVAQLAAIFIAGCALGLVGAGVSAASVAIGLTATDFSFMVPAADLARVLTASILAGGVGAVLGGGIGALVRNTGGAVTGTILLLIIVPPLAVQMASESASWVPATLADVMSGVDQSVGIVAAIAALAVWAVLPAVVGLGAVRRRDVV